MKKGGNEREGTGVSKYHLIVSIACLSFLAYFFPPLFILPFCFPEDHSPPLDRRLALPRA